MAKHLNSALLGVETSSPVFSVAVSDGDRILSFLSEAGTGPPSAFLMELIRRAVDQAGFKLEELQGLAVSIGPGSFTGLRVGVMTVKTTAWALKKPVLPVSTLEIIAYNLADSPQPIRPFLDARKGKVYTALFSSSGRGEMKRLEPDRLVAPEEALKNLQQGTVLVGDGLKRFGEQVSSCGETFTQAPQEQWTPRAYWLCRIAASRWPQGLLDDPHRLVPQYLYSKESDITGW